MKKPKWASKRITVNRVSRLKLAITQTQKNQQLQQHSSHFECEKIKNKNVFTFQTVLIEIDRTGGIQYSGKYRHIIEQKEKWSTKMSKPIM